MCGISGIFAPTPIDLLSSGIQAMVNCQTHRGPDGQKIWQNPSNNIVLGHNRLSIIDLSVHADQPMHYQGRYTLVFNGEIYNYIEIRETLQKQNVEFLTHSDTEVLLAAYSHWGESCLKEFEGMFAFAIWDEKTQSLFAARDRFGEKPFFYHFDTNKRQLLFASEIKALWAAGVPKLVDEAMLINYLTLGITYDVNHPTRTYYKNIQKLPAAHSITISLSQNWQPPQPKRYWQLKRTLNTNLNLKTAVEDFDQLLFSSVAKRLRSEVPIGTSLSGGLDSSSIVAITSRLSRGHHSNKAFTAIFPGFEKNEFEQASIVADAFSLTHHTVAPNAETWLEDFEDFMHVHDEPISSASVYAQYKVYQLANQQGIKVLLDGQGADETLAGYYKYIHWYLQELYLNQDKNLLPTVLKELDSNNIPFQWNWKNRLAAEYPKLTSKLLLYLAQWQQQGQRIIEDSFRKRYIDTKSLFKPVVQNLNDILFHDITQLGLEELLRNADRNSMAHSVEVRLPFLSHELVQFCFSLPSNFKIKEGFSKYILRYSMKDMLPSSIAWRKDKVGFEPPQAQWLNNPAIKEKITSAKKRLTNDGILDKKIVDRPIIPSNAYDANNLDWRILCAEAIM